MDCLRVREAERLKPAGFDYVPQEREQKAREFFVLAIDRKSGASVSFDLNWACEEGPAGIVQVDVGDEVNAPISLRSGHLETIPKE